VLKTKTKYELKAWAENDLELSLKLWKKWELLPLAIIQSVRTSEMFAELPGIMWLYSKVCN